MNNYTSYLLTFSCIIKFYNYKVSVFPASFSSYCIYVNCRKNHICNFFRSSLPKWDYQWLLFYLYMYTYIYIYIYIYIYTYNTHSYISFYIILYYIILYYIMLYIHQYILLTSCLLYYWKSDSESIYNDKNSLSLWLTNWLMKTKLKITVFIFEKIKNVVWHFLIISKKNRSGNYKRISLMTLKNVAMMTITLIILYLPICWW